MQKIQPHWIFTKIEQPASITSCPVRSVFLFLRIRYPLCLLIPIRSFLLCHHLHIGSLIAKVRIINLGRFSCLDFTGQSLLQKGISLSICIFLLHHLSGPLNFSVLVHMLSDFINQCNICRQPGNTLQLIFGKPFRRLSLFEFQLTCDNFSPKTIHRKMECRIIIFYRIN